MSKRKGDYHAEMPKSTARYRMWRSIRILVKDFTISQVAATSGATYENAKKFVSQLSAHGFVSKCGCRYRDGVPVYAPGVYQGYRLVSDVGPQPPIQCSTCGRRLREKCEPKTKENENGAVNGRNCGMRDVSRDDTGKDMRDQIPGIDEEIQSEKDAPGVRRRMREMQNRQGTLSL